MFGRVLRNTVGAVAAGAAVTVQTYRTPAHLSRGEGSQSEVSQQKKTKKKKNASAPMMSKECPLCAMVKVEGCSEPLVAWTHPIRTGWTVP